MFIIGANLEKSDIEKIKVQQKKRACNKICVSTDFKYNQKYGL